MKEIFQTILLFALTSGTLYGQKVKYSIGVQANPIIHFNAFKASDPSLGRMKQWNMGSQTGVEFNYNANKRFTISPVFKYYRKSQKIEQDEFYGYLNADSKTWMKYTYESIDFGLLLKYHLSSKPDRGLDLIAGVTYSFANGNELNWGYYINGDNPETIHLAEIGYLFTPNVLGTKINMWHPVVGLRKTNRIKRIGVFEYGFLFYIPTRNMPEYEYKQFLQTDNNGTIHSSVSYESKQYSAEVSIIYHLFNFNNKLRLVHPKRER